MAALPARMGWDCCGSQMKRLRRLFHLREWGPAVEDGVIWEIEHHLEERVDELVADGLTPAAARQEALEAFGDIHRLRRQLIGIDGRSERRRLMLRMLDDLAQDVRYGLRGVRLNPGIALGVILTLALGIGANAAMFSVVDALMLRPLPYEAPEELAELFMVTPPNEFGRPNIPYEVARGWQESQERPVMLHARATALYTGGAEPKMIPVQPVTPEFSDIFGVAPVLGRSFESADAEPSAPDVVVLDHEFWQTEFGGKDEVLGQTVELNGIVYTVIGVMPKGFRFPTYSTTEAWVPFRSDGGMLGRSGERRIGYIAAVMRVPAADFATVNAEAGARGRALFQQEDPASETQLRLQPLAEGRGGNADTKQAMLLLSGAVVLILLVAGVNMVSLLLARGSARANEMAVRMALGAARGRIVRQIGTEAVLLALLGGVVAVAVAVVVLRALQGIMPGSITFFSPYVIAIEQRTLIFTFIVALASGLLFGLLPAFSATGWARSTDGAALTRYASRTRGRRRLRRGLVVAEIAFSVILLITASLLIGSFTRLMNVDPGMRLENMAVLQFPVSSSRYPEATARGAYLRRLEERIAALPGVESTTLTGGLPPNTSFSFGLALEAEGRPPVATDEDMFLPFTEVGSDFFDVTGARLLEGRAFTRTDPYDNVIIDHDLARHLWAEGAAVGRRFRLDAESDWLTVVGVMADLRLLGPDERRGEFGILRPLGSYDDIGGQLAMAIRTRGDPRPVLAAIRDAVRDVDANQPIQDLVPATTYYAEAVDLPKFLAVLMGILAALALALAAVGVHGALAFGVAQRRHELGVRIVLGARAFELGRLVVGEGLVLAGIGIVLGIAGALLSTRIVQGVLYGVDAVDVPTFGIAVAGVLIVVAAATLRPAYRAARLDPGEVLRNQ